MKISVLGTGEMGSRMAARLLTANHEVTVWNRTKDKTAGLVKSGAHLAATPKAAVQDADYAISMVRDDAASRQVWLDSATGALSNLPPECVVIESSTISVAWARELAQECILRNTAFLDAPVAGSRPQAEAGALIYFVGGDADVLLRAAPILRAMGASVHHAGNEPGSGAAVKLAVNSLLGIQVAAMGEIVGFLRNCGVDEAAALNIIAQTSVSSPAAKVVADAMLAKNFAPQFPIELAAKDFDYIAATAATNRSAVPLAEAAQQVFACAIEKGLAAENLTSVVKLYHK